MNDKERELRLKLAYEQLDKVWEDCKYYGDKEQAKQLKEIMKQLDVFIMEMRCEKCV